MALNRVYKRVCHLETWPFLEGTYTASTVAGTASLTINVVSPTANPIDKITSVVNTTSKNALSWERDDRLRKWYPGDLSTQGDPRWYYYVGETVKVYPVPDAVYVLDIHGLQDVVELLANDSVPILIPDEHVEVLLFGTLLELSKMDDATEQIALWKSEFKDRLDAMRQDVWTKQADQFDYIQDVMDDFEQYSGFQGW